MEPFRPAPVTAPIPPELLGARTRTILAGIKQGRASPQESARPRKMRGIAPEGVVDARAAGQEGGDA